MAKRLIEFNPDSGISTYHHYDALTKETTIEEVQDATPHIELSKQLQNDESYKADGIKRSWMHLAHIPNNLLVKWSRECGASMFSREHINYCAKKVHERDYSYLKTARGKFLRGSQN